MGHTRIDGLIDKFNTTLRDRVGDQKVKWVLNSPYNSNTNKGKQTYADVLHKKKLVIKIDKKDSNM